MKRRGWVWPVLLVSMLAPEGASPAGDTGIEVLRFPRQHVSVFVGTGWRWTQATEPFLTLEKSSTRLVFHTRAYAGEEAQEAVEEAAKAYRRTMRSPRKIPVEPWDTLLVPGGWLAYSAPRADHDGRLFAAVARQPPPGLWIEAQIAPHDAALVPEVRRIVDCLDLSYHQDGGPHVDWHQGWTLRFTDGWTPTAPLLDSPTWKSQDGSCRIAAVDLAEHVGSEWASLLSDGPLHSATLLLGDIESALSGLSMDIEAPLSMGQEKVQEQLETTLLEAPLRQRGSPESAPRGRLLIRVAQEHPIAGGVGLVLIAPDPRTKGARQGMEIFTSWRAGTYPGTVPGHPQPARALEEERRPVFPSVKAGPSHRIPRRWLLTALDREGTRFQVGIPCAHEYRIGIVEYLPGDSTATEDWLPRRWKVQAPDAIRTETEVALESGWSARLFSARFEPGLEPAWRSPRPPQRFLRAWVPLEDGALSLTFDGDADVVDLQLPVIHAWLHSLRVE